jgi:dipeptidyl aminopeptidase/acylaminoacyl peptidase
MNRTDRTRRTLRRIILMTVMLSCVVMARADRDIVYAARYYTPPGSRATSHWHLYRINPDGTGKMQLTSGSDDDYQPLWSPDGRQILFMRVRPLPEPEPDRWTLCLIAADGGPVKRLLDLKSGIEANCRWLPDGRIIALDANDSSVLFDVATGKTERLKDASPIAFSPDGAWMAVSSGQSVKLMPARGGKEVAIQGSLNYPLFQDNRTIVGVAGQDDMASGPLRVIGLDGKERRQLQVKFPSSAIDDPGSVPAAVSLLAAPGHSNAIIYVINRHDSTVGTNYQFCLVDLATGNARDLGEGRFLTWSPDGSRYCIAPGRDLGPYGKGRNGAPRTVWVAPLQIGSVADGVRRRTISVGTVWVGDGDWRKSH